MPAPKNISEFLDLIRKSHVVEEKKLEPHLEKLHSEGLMPPEPNKLAGVLVRDGILTHFQAEQLLQGKWRRFTIGKYKVLERLGSGGMGSVYLCEHKFMRRRVAVKVLPNAKAAEESSLQRFYREARAVAALDHPNIVHAYDIDQDENLHFLVMEYVDGSSLQDIVKKTGPLSPVRGAHYIHQSTMGLSHAHAAGLVHRDIKPGNLLVDRFGTIKILDMGLARFFTDEEDILTKKYDENVLGTADYLAPEQAVDSHEADTRADIYSLGATFYFLLTGKTPFEEGTVAQKLIWHQTRQPKPIAEYRSDVPEEMVAIISKMMAKRPEDRYQDPLEVGMDLEPWTRTPIDPPSESEMPKLSLAAAGPTSMSSQTSASLQAASVSRKNWQVSSMATGTQSPQPMARVSPPSPPPASPPPSSSKPASPPKPAATGPTSPAPPPPSPQPKPATPAPQNQSPKPAARTATKPTTPPPSPQQDSPAPHLPEVATRNSISTAPAPQPSEPSNNNYYQTTGDTGTASSEMETLPDPFFSTHRLKSDQESSRRSWWIITGSVVMFLIVFGLIWKFVLEPLTVTPPEEKPPLIVSKTGNGDYTTIFGALRKAEPGDVIELHDENYSENVVINPDRIPTTEITIRPAPGKTILWSGVSTSPILTITNAENFTLQGEGITLDGQERIGKLIHVTQHCPNLKIQGVKLKGFSQSGIYFTNCTGKAGKYVVVKNIQSEFKGLPAITFLFNSQGYHNPQQNDYIRIQNCNFSNASVDQAIQKIGTDPLGPNVLLPTE